MRSARGALVEYTSTLPPLLFAFDFNPETITRTRVLTLPRDQIPGHRGYDFSSPSQVPRAAIGAKVQAETFTLKLLLDASDAIADKDPVAMLAGIEPSLDTLRAMLEPKTQGPGGVRKLVSLGAEGKRAFQRNQTASVLLFIWGTHVLPVFLTNVTVEEQAHLPTLAPYRATVSISLQVIESANPFWRAEQLRQAGGAMVGSVQSVSTALGGLL
jgi:Contractile injection system tube protein